MRYVLVNIINRYRLSRKHLKYQTFLKKVRKICNRISNLTGLFYHIIPVNPGYSHIQPYSNILHFAFKSNIENILSFHQSPNSKVHKSSCFPPTAWSYEQSYLSSSQTSSKVSI